MFLCQNDSLACSSGPKLNKVDFPQSGAIQCGIVRKAYCIILYEQYFTLFSLSYMKQSSSTYIQVLIGFFRALEVARVRKGWRLLLLFSSVTNFPLLQVESSSYSLDSIVVPATHTRVDLLHLLTYYYSDPHTYEVAKLSFIRKHGEK